MNGTTLKALRLALGLTQEEASNMIGAVSIRTWRYWEDEGRTIPGDVKIAIRELGIFKQNLITETINQIELMIKSHGLPEAISINYYSTLDTWMTQDGALPSQWKPHCMAMAAIAEKYDFVNLIAFDAVQYQTWLGKRLDSSAMRAQWATAN